MAGADRRAPSARLSWSQHHCAQSLATAQWWHPLLAGPKLTDYAVFVVVTCFQAPRTPPTRRGVVKELEAAGLIERIAIPTTPVRIHYRLAPDGQALVEALMPLARWSMRRSGSRGTGMASGRLTAACLLQPGWGRRASGRAIWRGAGGQWQEGAYRPQVGRHGAAPDHGVTMEARVGANPRTRTSGLRPGRRSRAKLQGAE
ncbi:winged helix-turn-helix transcriptional regulator [Streptomyces sp. NPDC052016]|uniref:winged helix-turn-helix transcriptional regulator n=1 Tax=Streptomyces sp. NPDC052016 TaxID=3365680 RepID=UPI0037D89D7A